VQILAVVVVVVVVVVVIVGAQSNCATETGAASWWPYCNNESNIRGVQK